MILSRFDVVNAQSQAGICSREKLASVTINIMSREGEDEGKAVRVAAMRGDVDGLRLVLSRGAPVDAANGHGTTALHWCVQKEYEKCARLLVDARADLNAMDGTGERPLHKAVKIGRLACVVLLCDAGAVVDQLDHDGRSALSLALLQYHNKRDDISLGCVMALLDAGANIQNVMFDELRFLEMRFIQYSSAARIKARACRSASAALFLVFKKKRLRDLAMRSALLVWSMRRNWPVDAPAEPTATTTGHCQVCGCEANCVFLSCGHVSFCERCSRAAMFCPCTRASESQRGELKTCTLQ